MSTFEIAFLAGIVAAFVIFSAALAWVSHEYKRHARAGRARSAPQEKASPFKEEPPEQRAAA